MVSTPSSTIPLSRFADAIPWEMLRGLRPRAWVCVGAGFVREDLKAQFIQRIGGFTAEALTTPQELCVRLVAARRAQGPAAIADRLASPATRQEILRTLLTDRRLGITAAGGFAELKRLKRRGGFFRKLDRAIQQGRMAFSHEEEERALYERLEQVGNPSMTRQEVRMLAVAYETWLREFELWDAPRLYREAIEVLSEGWPDTLARPEEVLILTASVPESLERSFQEALSTQVAVRLISPRDEKLAAGLALDHWQWERWHTLDDAAEGLADRLADGDWEDQVVLIPESGPVRRSLKRALGDRGIPLADTRDPTRIRWEETLKAALLPLELVARGFERTRVFAYFRAFHPDFFQSEVFLKAFVEINSRGIRQGLKAYAGGELTELHAILSTLQVEWGGKRTLIELAERHRLFLIAQFSADAERAWVIGFFEQLWREFHRDLERVGLHQRRGQALYWYERIAERVSESNPPVDRLKPTRGVKLFRLSQAPLERPRRVFVLGMPADWLGADSVGDYWFSERDRESLATEFALRSSRTATEERTAVLESWVDSLPADGELCFIDAAYDPDGRERESIFPVLSDLARWATREEVERPAEDEPDFAEYLAGKVAHLESPVDHGAHPRWIASYGSLRPIPPQETRLPGLAPEANGQVPVISATTLDHYSRCPVMALAYHRWKLRDVREPGGELWAESRGNILHRAVRLLVESRVQDSGGPVRFELSATEALDRAWSAERPRGLLQSERLRQVSRQKLLLVLEAFQKKEREYAERSQTTATRLEDHELRLGFGDFEIVGKPDRIDEHPEGLFILDYKSGGTLPHGTEMADLGYRLQLPFYALASRQQLGREAIGVQFVELNRKAARTRGIFFKGYNGKTPGSLTQARANSKSLFEEEPAALWPRIETQLRTQARGYLDGIFDAAPKKGEKECETCAVSDLCGWRRLIDARPSQMDAGGEAESGD